MQFLVFVFLMLASVCHAEEQATVNQELDEVVVTASRVEEQVKETPVTINVVSNKELETIKIRNASDVMNRLPGTYTHNFGGESELTSIRVPTHFTNPYTIVLVDGLPTTSYGSGSSGQLREINIRNIERIEVIKGPASALYGSNAIGGIVNIITKDPSPEPRVNVWGEYGEYDQWRGGVTGSMSNDRFSFFFDANYANSDNWRQHSEYDKTAGSVKLQYLPSETSLLALKLDYISFDQDMSGSLRKEDFKENWRHSYHTFTYSELDKITPTIIFNKFFETSEFRAVLALRDIDQKNIPNYGIYQKTWGPFPRPFVGRLNKIDGLDANLQLLYSRDFNVWRSKIVTGIDTELDDTDTDTHALDITWDPAIKKYTSFTVGDLSKSFDIKTKVGAPYLQVAASPVDALRITAGARYDDVTYEVDDNIDKSNSEDLDFSEFTPKVGATYEFTPSINGFLSYSQGFVVPTTSQLLTSRYANDDLDPEDATNYEIGLRGSFWNRKLDLDVSLYYMDIEDKIIQSEDDVYVNAGETTHRGIETVVILRPHNKFYISASYTYAENEYEEFTRGGIDFSDNTLPRSPDHHLNARLTVLPITGLKIELEIDDISSQYVDDQNRFSYSRPTLVNVRTSYDWRDLSLWAHVINLTDEEYASYVSFSNSDGENYYSGEPRTYFVGLSYNWSK